ncbi:MAG: KamA family protein [Bacteroidales bacterium]|jgi:lysine 2,3-aminomutase|nr:KamA family protein [Bacteroidales bacterium]
MSEVKSNYQAKVEAMEVTPHAKNVLKKLLEENPELHALLDIARDEQEVSDGIRRFAIKYLEGRPEALAFYKGDVQGRESMEKLNWQDIAAIRLLDYADHAGREYKDLNLRGRKIYIHPYKILWQAYKTGKGGVKAGFFKDMLELFRQFRGHTKLHLPDREQVLEWMERFPSGLDPRIVKIREVNKRRIINILIGRMEKKNITSKRFALPEGISHEEKVKLLEGWWENHLFHLRFAIRDPELLNEMLDNSLGDETMDILYKARDMGIPFFINPYYLSLLNTRDVPEFARQKDQAIRYYVIYSKQLVEEFGHIVAWEKEDIVEPGKPNAAGWILPTRHNVHRRYPEVAILIPDTMGRACGGLCASCQRMYDFQRGRLNFNLDKLLPRESWEVKLQQIMKYWEEDSRLRDILITGGDALMSRDDSLQKILDAVYDMALRKKELNRERPDGQKFAEILRVRLGTRLPAYLPQRITPSLTKVLADFKAKASAIGIRQFVIQTHFQSPMEVTPEAKLGVSRLISAGWTVTNQLVFTAPASKRGHTAKLRQVLNDIGVLPYYTFSVKGYRENSFKFATNARAVQEQLEEKYIGFIPLKDRKKIKTFPLEAENMVEHIDQLRKEAGIPFLATDRNVLNLPGVGKSMTYRVIGITRQGRRILEFDHDHTRSHSPIIKKIGKFVIIESKSISSYLDQLAEMGEDIAEYNSIWGYSLGETEPRMSIYEYPDYDYDLTDQITNFGE